MKNTSLGPRAGGTWTNGCVKPGLRAGGEVRGRWFRYFSTTKCVGIETMRVWAFNSHLGLVSRALTEAQPVVLMTGKHRTRYPEINYHSVINDMRLFNS